MELILIHNFTKQNRGVGISVYFVGADIPGVKAIPFKGEDCLWEVCLITKKGRKLPPEARSFLKYTESFF